MNDWRRVTKKEPCPICGKGDWCTIGQFRVCCMRVQSDAPVKNGGWLHNTVRSNDFRRPEPVIRQDPVVRINATALLREWRNSLWTRPITDLASRLDLSAWALDSMGVVWAHDHRAWAFPMRDAYGNAVGIRLRNDDGRKWAVKGSRQGIFSARVAPSEICWVTEGPTDAAAGLQIGLFAIGRPSCTGAVQEICDCVRRADSRRVVIVCDNDSPGYQGACVLAKALPVPSCTIAPPAKDLREYVTLGGDAVTLLALLNGQLWSRK